MLMQVAGENEVKAQIKLRFKTATGQPVVIIKAFQVTFDAQEHLWFFLGGYQHIRTLILLYSTLR